MKSLNSIYEEFALKYNHTVMKVTELMSGKWAVGYVEGDSGNTALTKYYAPPLVGLGSFSSKNMCDYRIEKFLPEEGWYTKSDGAAFFLKRKSDKQWKNSYCNDMYGVQHLGKGVLSKGAKDLNIVKAICTGKYNTDYFAARLLARKSGKNIAITRRVAIVITGGSARAMYMNMDVGAALKNGISLKEKIQPMRELLEHEGVPVL